MGLLFAEAAKIKVFLHTQNKTFIWKKKEKKKKNTGTKNMIYEKQEVFDSFHEKQKKINKKSQTCCLSTFLNAC